MSILPIELYRAAQVRALDRAAIDGFGISAYSLMQRAGQAAFNLLRTCWPQARRILVMAGTGNNGGDGYVVAQLAREVGLDVRVVQCGDVGRIRGDANRARDAYLTAGGEIVSFINGELPPADVIVDALLGTGLQHEVREDLKVAITAINAHCAPVLAIDAPSGLQSDTGMPLGAAVMASYTISFIGLKRGLYTGVAADYTGSICFDDLGVPSEVYRHQRAAAYRLDLAQFSDLLAPRARASHKGYFGHVLVIGGERGMGGAPRMASEAAARLGAGLVTIATRAVHASTVNAVRPELMAHSIEKPAELTPLFKRATVVAIGPGLGQTDWSRSLLRAALQSDAPKVIDADGLNLLALTPERREDWVLTPHPGEAAKLLGTDTATIQQDRFAAAEKLHERYGGVCVLKGVGTLIHSTERIAVCTAGNPGMASGGMGDVLTGVIASLLAQGFSSQQAAEVGVCLHATAADCAAADLGERGLLATDLFDYLRRLVNP
jgi:ADP-dependent NAD(P)H-hydrate dehydratase / NAD(P)H-hydrate epimerase